MKADIIISKYGFYIFTGEEQRDPEYIIPTSNFGTCTSDSAYLFGVPCKVVSKDRRKYIDVISMVTGIQYTIPTGWAKEYYTLEEANKHADVKGYVGASVNNLIGKKYWPRDNSYIKDVVSGSWASLFGEECEIVSVPFKEEVGDRFDNFPPVERTFILVKYNGKVYRTLFEEWCLAEDKRGDLHHYATGF